MLRVILGEATGAAEATTVSVLEANIDDLSPQVLAYAMERLLEAGALDVTLQPIVMKKGRPGNLLRVLARPEDREALAQIDLRRNFHAGPAHLHRRAPRAGAPLGGSGDAARQGAHEGVGEGAYAPEYEDCRKLALRIRRGAETDHRGSQLRVPEQIPDEILPHHSDLLRECRAAHRPRLHHHRGRPIKRFKRMQGYDAVLTTGTDEHGVNVERAAERAGKSPQEFCRRRSPPNSSRQWEMLGLRDRPLPAHHRPAARHAWCSDLFKRCRENGYIYKGSYTGQYCIFDNLYVNDAKPGDPCPDCGRPTETVTEENFFFKLSAFTDRLLELYESQPDFIQPETRRNEVLAFVKAGLTDLSITPHQYQMGHSGGGRSAARFLRLVRRAHRLT